MLNKPNRLLKNLVVIFLGRIACAGTGIVLDALILVCTSGCRLMDDDNNEMPVATLGRFAPAVQQVLTPAAINDPAQRRYTEVSARLPFEKPDACPDALLNRILWNAQKGSKVPYPVWAVAEQDAD